jgi:hypothetical protein
MRILLGAAVCALLLAAPAAAQTTPAAPVAPSPCGELPTLPTLPDGATATREQMEAGNAAFLAWFEQYSANVRCRHDEASALRAQYDARVAEHNAAVEGLTAANESWRLQGEAWNTRGGNERRR